MILDDFTPETHREYGAGYFCTLDVFERLQTLVHSSQLAMSILLAIDKPAQMQRETFLTHQNHDALKALREGLEL